MGKDVDTVGGPRENCPLSRFTAQSFLYLGSGVALWVRPGVRFGFGLSFGRGINECIILRWRSGGLHGTDHVGKQGKLAAHSPTEWIVSVMMDTT